MSQLTLRKRQSNLLKYQLINGGTRIWTMGYLWSWTTGCIIDQGAQLQLTEIHCRDAMTGPFPDDVGFSDSSHFALSMPQDLCQISVRLHNSLGWFHPTFPHPLLHLRSEKHHWRWLTQPIPVLAFHVSNSAISLKKILACLIPFWHLFSRGPKLTQSAKLIQESKLLTTIPEVVERNVSVEFLEIPLGRSNKICGKIL